MKHSPLTSLNELTEIASVEFIYKYLDGKITRERQSGAVFSTYPLTMPRPVVWEAWEVVQEEYRNDPKSDKWVKSLDHWLEEFLPRLPKSDTANHAIFKARENLLTGLRVFHRRSAQSKDEQATTVMFENLDGIISRAIPAPMLQDIKEEMLTDKKWGMFKRKLVREALAYVLADPSALNAVLQQTKVSTMKQKRKAG